MKSAEGDWTRRVVATAWLVGALSVWSCESEPQTRDAPREAERASRVGAEGAEESGPERVILMIGDGMGTASISGASYGAESALEMGSMEEFGFLSTHSYEYVTTDSAASATAFATGEKTHFEAVSVEPGTAGEEENETDRHLETLLEASERRGWKTGLVSTVRIVHATPAAFAAHRASRHSYEAIAGDIAESGVDVLLGGGREYFTDREDGGNLLRAFAGKGYATVEEPGPFESAVGRADRLVGLFRRGDAPAVRSGKRSVGLASRTRGALEVLDRNNDEGFLLVVEGAQIDWRGHDLDGRGMIASTRHFDRAVGVALEYTREREDTLLVVASDHETGGLAIMDGAQRERIREALGGRAEIEESTSYPGGGEEPGGASPVMPGIELSSGEGSGRTMVPVFGHFSVASRAYAEEPGEFYAIHTPELVPMFAEGKGARFAAGAEDNAELGRRLERLVAGEWSPEAGGRRGGGSSKEGERPRNVVLFVGDGVGMDAWTAAHYAEGGLAVREAAHQGMAPVRGVDELVQDDAAAATSLAVGRRVRNGSISVRADGEGARLRTVLERAEGSGYRTGIVTTDTLTNPTTAAMYAHGGEELSESDRAAQFVGLAARIEGSDGVDLAYGGGRAAFERREIERLSGRGVDVGMDWSGGGEGEGQVVRLLAERAMAPAEVRRGDGSESGQPSLVEMTRAALERLKQSERPFFLIVEAGGPGIAQREVERGGRLVEAIEEFDDAVREGWTFAERDGETLVVATADADQTLSVFDNHYGFSKGNCGVADRCGGPLELDPIDVAVGEVPNAEGFGATSLQGEYAPPRIFLQYAWPVQVAATEGVAGMNSANFVPVFASGPRSGRFEGRISQTAVGETLSEWARRGARASGDR